MSPAFHVNYVTGRRQIANIKVNRCWSKVFFPEKIICQVTIREFEKIYVRVHHGAV